MADQANMQPRVLRIGIVQGGKIVHERLIKPGQGVTIGESPKNTFVVKAEGLPKRFTLFQPKGSSYQLGVTSQMSGKVALAGGIQSMGDLTEAYAAVNGVHHVELSHTDRGKVVIGDVTVLFQFVAAPPESARKVTRHDFRPRLMDEDDPIFLGLLSLWSTVGAVMLVYAYNTEPIDTISIEELPDRFVNIVIPEKTEDPPDLPEDIKGPETEAKEEPKEEPKEEKKEDDPPPPKNEEERRENEARRLEKKREDLTEKSAVLAMIGTRGANNSGSTVADLFGDGDAALGDLDDALDGVTTAEVADGDPDGLKGSADGGGRDDASVGIDRGGGGQAAKSKKVEAAAPKGRTSVGKVEAYDGEGADAVKAALRKYSSQLKACYEGRLKENPNISGRVVLEIDVNGGRVATALIAENSTGDSALGSCITKRARGWRLPSETTGTFAFPLMFEGD
jgi:outer membrane biosynthesis protein TonB